METLHKKMLQELDELIARAPDIDIDYEYRNFRETHEKVLQDVKTLIPGLASRLLFITDLLRFQMNFMLGADVTHALSGVLNFATRMGREDVIHNFSNHQRMEQMAKILEQKSIGLICEKTKAQKASRPHAGK